MSWAGPGTSAAPTGPPWSWAPAQPHVEAEGALRLCRSHGRERTRRGQTAASRRQGQLGMEWDEQAAWTGLSSLEMNSGAGRDSGKTRRHCIKLPQTSFPHLPYLHKHQSQVSSCAQQLTHLHRHSQPSQFPTQAHLRVTSVCDTHFYVTDVLWCLFQNSFLLLICQSSKLKFS